MLDNRPLIRIATAGSVDDGKSTLIGRLLYETDSLKDDQMAAVHKASAATGETEVNLALVTDGLSDERSQKITIDVAYRHFATQSRRYLLADTPGHVQYTRNMFTGISRADVVIILTDALRGLTEQTFRHLFLASLLRAPHVVVVVNKMDAVDWKEEVYQEVRSQITKFTSQLAFPDLRILPLSALTGENLLRPAQNASWHKGGSLLEVLESLTIETRRSSHEFRFPVQAVIRPNSGFRGALGRAVSGTIRPGEEVSILPLGTRATIKEVLTPEGAMLEARTDQPICLTFQDEVDMSRGSVISRPASPPTFTNRFEAMVCWMGAPHETSDARYRVIHTTQDAAARVEKVSYVMDVAQLHRQKAEKITVNEVARIEISTSAPICADVYEKNKATGSFLLVDQDSGAVAAAGVILSFPINEPQPTNQKGMVVWLTGMSGSGKSTLSSLAAEALRQMGRQVVCLDGDEVREGLSSDLGFSMEDRAENIRRSAHVARLLANQGLIVLCTFISPLESHRALARSIVGDSFYLVAVECDIESLVQRDPKGLYARAAAGEIKDFTGLTSSYERPDQAELRLDTSALEPDVSLGNLLDEINLWKH